jgi:hypothetical protein
MGLAANAAANFTGYSGEFIDLGNGRTIVNVFANFTHVNDRVLNVYNLQLSGSLADDFHQSEANPFWKAGNTQNKNTSDDSWIAIGTNPNGSGNAGGNGGVVVGDPNFVNFDDSNDSTDFSYIEGIGSGAGWYNGAPANSYGYAFDAGRVLLAHFVLPSDVAGSLTWSGSLTVFLNGATSSSNVSLPPFTIVWDGPAPGALGVLFVAGLGSPRRRRR